ncbi:HNH endonuclease [Embleya hyalina]|uniref:HNH endonuclease n=1 Tax=Embleya hyalina TaxID=516124 RepID=UPI001C3FD7AB|nr:HNH endonuclease signature motif containing protein [Embleya hyalina]
MPRAASICLRDGCTSKTVLDGRCSDHQLRKSWDRPSARNLSRPSDFRTRRTRALVRDRWTCQRCGARTELEVDHIVPVSRGGTWDLSNLLTLCRACHRQKTYSSG